MGICAWFDCVIADMKTTAEELARKCAAIVDPDGCAGDKTIELHILSTIPLTEFLEVARAAYSVRFKSSELDAKLWRLQQKGIEL